MDSVKEKKTERDREKVEEEERERVIEIKSENENEIFVLQTWQCLIDIGEEESKFREGTEIFLITKGRSTRGV